MKRAFRYQLSALMLIVTATHLVWCEPPREPTPAPVPEMCLWRWEDVEGNFTYTIGPEDDASGALEAGPPRPDR